jgi:TolB protein
MRVKFPFLLLLLMIQLPGIAWADDLVIRIDEGHEGAIAIGVVPFKWSAEGALPPASVESVIANDLARSGYFNPLPDEDIIEKPFRLPDVMTGTWRRLQVDYILIGEITGSALEGYELSTHLVNVVEGKALFSLRFTARAGALRYTAHHIADTVFEKLINRPGAFRTRIAYVTASGFSEGMVFALMVADADGFNPQSVVRSRQPLMSPAWSPDARKLAYVSFEKGSSNIYMQDIATGAREQIASFKGINGAPSFSPDGTRLALTLSRSGNPEIYSMDLASRRLTQLTDHWGIDTEPVWSPDGQRIVFTSDRGGKPQLYEMSSNGDGKAVRITRQGDYNARASLSPEGDRVAMVTGSRNEYRIAVLDRSSNALKILSAGPLDESPSFAPNGSMVLYASRKGTQGVLSAVPVLGSAATGRIAHQLIFSEGDIREPAWSPIRR